MTTFGCDDGEQVLLVDLEDPVQPLERQHDAAADRHGAAACSRCRAPRGDERHARVVAPGGDARRSPPCRREGRRGPGGARCLRASGAVRVEARRDRRAPTGPPTMAATKARRRRFNGRRSRRARAGVRAASTNDEQAPASLAQPLERRRVGDAQEAGRVERLARRQRDARLVEQRLREVGGRPEAVRRQQRRRCRRTGRTRRPACGTRGAGRPSASPSSWSRRLRYSSSIARTGACDPVSAATAAFCVIDDDVRRRVALERVRTRR